MSSFFSCVPDHPEYPHDLNIPNRPQPDQPGSNATRPPQTGLCNLKTGLKILLGANY